VVGAVTVRLTETVRSFTLWTSPVIQPDHFAVGRKVFVAREGAGIRSRRWIRSTIRVFRLPAAHPCIVIRQSHAERIARTTRSQRRLAGLAPPNRQLTRQRPFTPQPPGRPGRPGAQTAAPLGSTRAAAVGRTLPGLLTARRGQPSPHRPGQRSPHRPTEAGRGNRGRTGQPSPDGAIEPGRGNRAHELSVCVRVSSAPNGISTDTPSELCPTAGDG
jgi:hypothetical protein